MGQQPSFRRVVGAVLIAAACLATTSAPAADPSSAPATASAPAPELHELYPLEPPDTKSPRATLRSFVENMNRAHRLLMEATEESRSAPGFSTPASAREKADHAEEFFDRAARCLNLSRVPSALKTEVAYEGALQLKEILDRTDMPDLTAAPDLAALEQRLRDKLPEIVSWRIPHTGLTIEKVQSGPRQGEYLFSAATIEHLPEAYEAVRALPYRADVYTTPGFHDFYISTPGRLLPPKWSFSLPAWSNRLIAGQTVWQWIALVLLSVLLVLYVLLAHRILLRRLSDRSPQSRFWRRCLFCLAILLAMHVLNGLLADHVNLTGRLLLSLGTGFSAVAWLAGAGAVLCFTMAWAEWIISSPKIDPEGIRASYIRAVFGVVGFVAAASVFIYGLSHIGVALLPLLTGVGIGGLAVALAARPMLENIIGSFMIFADQPYQVGERIRVMEHEGTVEAIGLRSTRVRMRSGNVMSFPNEKMASMEIENISRRRSIRRTFHVTITYDTPPEKIRRAKQILEEVLDVPATKEEQDEETHRNVAIRDPDFLPHVYFSDLNADSLGIYVTYWYHPPDFWLYMRHADWVNTQIIERFNAEGIDFAFPTQTLYLAGDAKRPVEVRRPGET